MNYSLLLDSLREQFHIDIHKCVREKESLAAHSTFRIGGPADLFLTLEDPFAMASVYRFAKENEIPVLILGNGSNVLFSDLGFRGIVLSTSSLRKICEGANSLVCDAGVALTSLAKTAFVRSLKGLEFAYGIPGSVGGAVYMNAGAYGGEISQVLSGSLVLNLATGEMEEWTKEMHRFGYRHSAVQGGEYLVVSSEFVLEEGSSDEIGSLMNENYGKRLQKQPLDYPSAGSTFKRPEGHFAGQLIEQCGLKGYRIGGAAVSEKHAGFIINLGNATASDVSSLIDYVQEKVKKETGISLETEVIRIGEKG